jgi:hypothetical protein
MWLQALFTAGDLLRALTQMTPARVSLDKTDPDRFIWVSKPESLRLAANGSIVIEARAQIRWDVLGLSVPVTLKKVELSLRPAVDVIDGQQALLFRVQVEQGDLSGVPAFVEKTLLGRVNEALRAADAKLAWRFLQTLDFHFPIAALEPVRTVSLYARSAVVDVSSNGLMLTVAWGADARVASGADAPTPPDVIAEVASPSGHEPVGGPRPSLDDDAQITSAAAARRV